MKNFKLIIGLVFLMLPALNLYGNNTTYHVTNFEKKWLQEEAIGNNPVLKEIDLTDFKLLPREEYLLAVELKDSLHHVICFRDEVEIVDHFDIENGFIKRPKINDLVYLFERRQSLNTCQASSTTDKLYYILVKNSNLYGIPLGEYRLVNANKFVKQTIFANFLNTLTIGVFLFLFIVVLIFSYLMNFRAWKIYAFHLLVFSFFLIGNSLLLNKLEFIALNLIDFMNYLSWLLLLIFISLKIDIRDKSSRYFESFVFFFGILVILLLFLIFVNSELFRFVKSFTTIVFATLLIVYFSVRLVKIRDRRRFLLAGALTFCIYELFTASTQLYSTFLDLENNIVLLIFFKEIMIAIYIINESDWLINRFTKQNFLFKSLRKYYINEKQSSISLKTEMSETEEKLVQNSLLHDKKEKLIIQMERMVSGGNFYNSRDSMRSVLGEIRDVEDKIGIKEFDFHFMKLNKEFFDILGDKFPRLSMNEKKLCAFIRMNLTSKEIAAVTGKAPNSVDVAKYRLRKKLNLPSYEDFLQFIHNIENAPSY